MIAKEQIQKHHETDHSQSRLERFVLGFEYNKTLQEIKRDVRNRTL